MEKRTEVKTYRVELFEIYQEMRDYGDGRWTSMWETLWLRIFGCYPVYREFFWPRKPSLFAKFVIWVFFKPCSVLTTVNIQEFFAGCAPLDKFDVVYDWDGTAVVGLKIKFRRPIFLTGQHEKQSKTEREQE